MAGGDAGPGDETGFIRALGDGLVLRRSGPADRVRLAEFHANTLLMADETPPLDRIYYFLLDLLGGAHPSAQPGAFLYVEDTATGKVVSSVGLLSAQWTFDGVPVAVGHPDMVSTDPAFRRRGLVAAQMAEVHAWSARQGHLMQVIPGIPWYYRQFGYEYALNMEGGRIAYRANVPSLPEGVEEPFTLRPVAEADLPLLDTLYAQATARSLVAVERDAAFWRFDAFGRHDQSGMASHHYVVTSPAAPARPLGVVVVARKLWGGRLGVRFLEIAPGTPLVEVAPSLLRALDTLGTQTAARSGETYEGIELELGEEHPLYVTAPEALPGVLKPYAWYVRIPDLPRFLTAVAPALQRRLAASPQAGWRGNLRLSFYRGGVSLRGENGCLVAEPWQPAHAEDGDALFPDLTFLKLLMGYRSLADLEYAYPDCSIASPAARALLPVLFPPRYSHIWEPA